jgi:hypothetical protein
MSQIPGTNIASRIAPFDTADTYATHDAKWGRDGYRSVDTLVERDAISTERRRLGMLVYVLETDTIYQLRGGITNSDWHIFLSGAGEGDIFGSVDCTLTDFIYTVYNSRIAPNAIINVNLKMPSPSSVLYQCGVTNIISGSFSIVLSDVPDISGYSIHWTVQNPI